MDFTYSSYGTFPRRLGASGALRAPGPAGSGASRVTSRRPDTSGWPSGLTRSLPFVRCAAQPMRHLKGTLKPEAAPEVDHKKSDGEVETTGNQVHGRVRTFREALQFHLGAEASAALISSSSGWLTTRAPYGPDFQARGRPRCRAPSAQRPERRSLGVWSGRGLSRRGVRREFVFPAPNLARPAAPSRSCRDSPRSQSKAALDGIETRVVRARVRTNFRGTFAEDFGQTAPLLRTAPC